MNIDKIDYWKYKKVTIFLDKNCITQPVCMTGRLYNALSSLWIDKSKIEISYLNSELKVNVPLVYISDNVAKSLTGAAQQVLSMYFKKVKNWYVSVLWNWINWEENLCNDEKDNDNDWKVDDNDPDCNKYFAVLYDKSEINIRWQKVKISDFVNNYKYNLYGYVVTWINVNTPLGRKIKDAIDEAIKNDMFTWTNKNMVILKNIDKYKIAIFQAPIIKINKSNRPKVSLYVMSHCPFGLQAEKAFLEVIQKFKPYADVNIKFVPYIMHWYQEAVDNIIQYCVSKVYPDKFIDYMKCFLSKEDKWWGNSKWCLEKIGVSFDDPKFKECFDDISKKVDLEGIKTSKEQFPRFNLDLTGAIKAGVQGSPTFVINWQKIEGIQRSARAYAEKICQAFKNPPEICEHLDQFSDTVYDPGFGWTSWWQNVWNASCGGR